MKLPLLILALSACLTATAQTADDDLTVRDDQTGNDEVIALPEGMTQNVDSLLSEWNAEMYLYADSSCVNPDYNPVYTTDEYRDRLMRIPAIMEMSYNSLVQSFIDRYTQRSRRTVGFLLGASNFYTPLFEEALDYYGLPLELKYLPVIESAYNPQATSPVGAAGLWQFMLSSAKRYNLEVNSLVDERRDPVKSSYAAAEMLRDLYRIYADWNLVIAAYNCGAGNVNKAIHRAGGVKDYWAIYPYLPKETRGYVPAFIAANYIMNYYCDHNICPMRTRFPIATDTVVVTRDVYVDQIAALCNIDAASVRALNPQYRTNLIPGSKKPSTLCLPSETLIAFIDLGDSVYNYRLSELDTRRTDVEPGGRVPAQPGAEATQMVFEDEQPVATSRTRAATSRSQQSRASRSKNSRRDRSSRSRRSRETTVRSGDTLSAIARRNGMTVSELKRKNRLKGDRIDPGQKLRVK